MIKGYLMD